MRTFKGGLRRARRTARTAVQAVAESAVRVRETDKTIASRAAKAAHRRDGSVVVLAESAEVAAHWADLLSAVGARPRKLMAEPAAEGTAALSRALTLLPSPAVIFDAVGGAPSDEFARWAAAFSFVPARGSYITLTSANRLRFSSPWVEGGLEGYHAPESSPPAVVKDLRDSISVTKLTSRTITLTKGRSHYTAVVEADASEVLGLRNPALRVRTLARLPAVTYRHRADITQHESGIELRNFGREFTAPEMTLRRYDGDLRWISHMLLVHEQTFLPPSFRFPNSDNLDAPVARRLAPRTYALPAKFEPVATRLEGPYFDLTGGWPSHFGHFMQQAVPKLWGWDAAKAAVPELKALVQIRAAKGHAFEQQILNAYGIESDDIVWVDERIGVDTFVSGTSMFQMHPPPYVHPGIQETWNRLGDALIVDSESAEKIFVSRRANFEGRSCRNLPEVEKLFESHGFTVFYPEDHPVGKQASMFAGARVVAGLGGSAMFNLAYARSLETLIILNHESYTARNEHLISAFHDWDVHYFWSRADVQHPKGGWSVAAYQSAWQFDFARNGAVLDELLSSL